MSTRKEMMDDMKEIYIFFQHATSVSFNWHLYCSMLRVIMINWRASINIAWRGPLGASQN